MPVAAIAGPVLGAVAGGLLSRGGAKQSGTTATTYGNPDVMTRAEMMASTGTPAIAYYKGPQLAEQSPFSIQGIQQLADSARNQSGLVGQAQGVLGQTLAGDFLNVDSNPYLQGAVQQALNQVRRNVSSQFGGESYGGSANQEWLNRQLAETALPIYSQAYQNERQNQLNALGLAPSLQTANIDQLLRAGGLEEQRRQQEIAAAKQEFFEPWDALSRYAGLGGSQVSSPYFTNPTASMLGGALTGAQIGGQVLGPIFNPSQSYSPFQGGLNLSSYGPAFA
jgi:hypothetical protein